MGNTNKNLLKAKREKNNEFFTLLIDIEKELKHYTNHFKGKTVYCNCDDVTSNFWKFFHLNFSLFGLKKLICTHYEEGQDESYAVIYEGGDDFNINNYKSIPIYSDDSYDAGDFRSKDCLIFLEKSDILVTNPPFDLLRQYVTQLVEYNVRFVIIGNKNTITYKEVFPLIIKGKIWLGTSIPNNFFTHKGVTKKVNGLCRWFTNLEIKKRHDRLLPINGNFKNSIDYKYYEGNEEHYHKYDNYDAINIDKISEIPVDYEGIMGVPVTFLDKYNPDEFEIFGMSASWDETINMKNLKLSEYKRHNPIINGEEIYRRIFIRNKHPMKKAE